MRGPRVLYEIVVQVIGDESNPSFLAFERYLPGKEPEAGLQDGEAMATKQLDTLKKWVAQRIDEI